ncbi:hypothetical protein FVP74_07445 [Microbacterium saccharophilum]|uniref:Uncharacterized protein n=1 Tax=Microbacterium saccharophilum TaxID=1213358 RepID=A0A5C8I958_9MICO|nr:hypothetical protein [Microbacterium saccharophilum]TXK14385.1 hypothetical protein FVP74_07445 [Microbacterium saccharophilum]GEP49273.1 hypothetical protein MSA03_27810 [Microbacterium saccharophilum]
MSNTWSWVFGILTAAAAALGVIFFAATQQVSGRDWIVLGIGGLIGATVAALVATFVFHSDARKNRLASAAATAAARTESDLKRLDEESHARTESEREAATAEQSRLDRAALAEVALIEKRTALLQALPTRAERLAELREEITQSQINIIEADGNYKSGMISARDAAAHRFLDIAHEREAAANTWKVAKVGFEEKLSALETERDRLARLTDEQYLAEQRRLRGLD